MKYAFGPIQVDTDVLELTRCGEPVAVEPQVFSLLVFLIENRERVLSKDEVIDAVWHGRIISDATLASRINAVRQAVGDSGKQQAIIRTYPRRGFRFVAELDEHAEHSDPVSRADPFTPPASASAEAFQRRTLRTSRHLSMGTLVLVLILAGVATWGGFRDKPPRPQPVPLAERPSIAVLPFTNLSGDPSQDYLADGITEDVITRLASFELFFVVSRNSTFTYRGTSVDVREVADDLGVRYVLEGSVRRDDERLRITAQLIDAVNDVHVWAQSYDREFANLFDVQDLITGKIAASVAPSYFTAELRRARRKPPADLGAWDAMMRGYWHFLRFTREDNAQAQHFLDLSLTLDGNGAKAMTLRSMTDFIDALYGWSPSAEDSMRSALARAHKALALDPNDAMVVRGMGVIKVYLKQHDEARDYFERAVRLSPSEGENHALLGSAYGALGDYQVAREMITTALRLSPRDQHVHTWYGYLSIAASNAGEYREAVEWAQQAIQANPTFPGGHRSLASAYGNLGELDEARSAARQLLTLLPGLTLTQLNERFPFISDPGDLARYLEGLRLAGVPEG